MSTLNDLNGAHVLITGAAGLLGFQHAGAVLDAGGKVILTDLSASRLENTKARLTDLFPSSDIISLIMDVTNQESVSETLAILQRMQIQVKVLINNAMIDSKVGSTGEISGSSRLEHLNVADWNQHLAVGLTGAAICCQLFGSVMAENQDGVIINIGSDLSVISPDQRLYSQANTPSELQPAKPLAYSVVKAGLVGLTRYVATYWGHRGVRCNMLSPGPVLVDQSPHFIADLSDRIPLGRLANANEYWSAIQFLCSPASSYLNGHNLVVDGGRSIW